MLPGQVIAMLERELDAVVHDARGVGGGCIANATRVETSLGTLFVKWSRGDAAAAFPAEAEGLRALRAAADELIIPEPLLAHGAEDGGTGVLVMEWLEPGQRGSDYWERFGIGLAALHQAVGEKRYGFHGDNFIGRLPQRNSWRGEWPDFFAELRLKPQMRRARDEGRWQAAWTSPFDRLIRRLPDLLPASPEGSVLHGDLWGGNVLVAPGGRPAVVDPAAYYGDREADLAMTELFGGFDRAFYAAYRQAWPLEPGYAERREIYNLYHLINHLNHFGPGYADAVARIVRRF